MADIPRIYVACLALYNRARCTVNGSRLALRRAPTTYARSSSKCSRGRPEQAGAHEALLALMPEREHDHG
jgi:hypothetical protein